MWNFSKVKWKKWRFFLILNHYLPFLDCAKTGQMSAIKIKVEYVWNCGLVYSMILWSLIQSTISQSIFRTKTIICTVEKLIKQSLQCKKLIENPIYVHSENRNFPWRGNSGNSRGMGNSQISGISREFPYGKFPGGKSLKPYGRKGMRNSHWTSLGSVLAKLLRWTGNMRWIVYTIKMHDTA